MVQKRLTAEQKEEEIKRERHNVTKAPSGRGLPTQEGGGETRNEEFAAAKAYAILLPSFSIGKCHLPPGGRLI